MGHARGRRLAQQMVRKLLQVCRCGLAQAFVAEERRRHAAEQELEEGPEPAEAERRGAQQEAQEEEEKEVLQEVEHRGMRRAIGRPAPYARQKPFVRR